MKREHKLYARDEIFRMLAAALIKKKPLPPEDWSVAGLDEEVFRAGSEYDPNLYLRHADALRTTFFYLVDFACRMPERINLSTETARVRKMCGELADEIEQITYEPEAVISRHGKLKAWLEAILAVQTSLIYREETARVIAEEQEAKRISRSKAGANAFPGENKSRSDARQSNLAKNILQKVLGGGAPNNSEQPDLY